MKSTAYNDLALAIYETLEGKKGEEFGRAMKDVVRFLAKRRLLREARNILAKVEKIANEKEGILKARISSATPLPEESKRLLREMLKKKYLANEVELLESQNKDLLGGFRIEANDEVLDNTIRGKIKKLERQLIK
ncbi:MAG TPA: ATP synthase F1 subunit delta [Candidatus Paceibacterota bacterium]|nr:ATP synthase F1 subunit delta [Candidatus Paceibacterota bacterium]